MSDNCHWLALGYNIPINPSKSRVYIWRKLKECGAEYFKQGVAVLPNSKENIEQFRELSYKIREMGGDASIIELRFIDENDEADMIYRFKNQSESDYAEILNECKTTLDSMRKQLPTSAIENTFEDVKRMMKKYSKVKARDFFPTGMSSDIEYGFSEIIDGFKETANDFASQLKKTFEKYK